MSKLPYPYYTVRKKKNAEKIHSNQFCNNLDEDCFICVLQLLIIQLDNAEHIKIHHNLLDYYTYPTSVSLKHIAYDEYSKKMLPDDENVSLGKRFIASKQFSFGSQQKMHHLREMTSPQVKQDSPNLSYRQMSCILTGHDQSLKFLVSQSSIKLSNHSHRL